MRVSRLGVPVALALAVLPLLGCRGIRYVAERYPRPDLASIYGPALPNPDRNPVLVIPGFGGSVLVREADGRKVWGAFFTGESLSYSSLEGLRAMSLDVGRLAPPILPSHLSWVPDDTRAVEILERAHANAVFTDVSFDVYATLVDLLEGAGYVEAERAEAEGSPGPLFFTLLYDWRQDAVAAAQELGRLAAQARPRVEAARRRAGLPPAPVRFDVIAHSMGGLIARYYLRYGARDVLGEGVPVLDWAGARDIDRLIMVSTPNLGAMRVFKDLALGRANAVLPTMQPAMIATMTAVYQLLPRAHHPLWIDETGQPADVRPLDVATWEANDWGPFEPSQDRYLATLFPDLQGAEERRGRMVEVMAAAFERGRRFAAALDGHPDHAAPVTQVLFTGDADPTLERVRVLERGGRRILDFSDAEAGGLTAPGDGTVTRASALADGRLARGQGGWLVSPIRWDWTAFFAGRHATFLRHPSFQDHLLHLLLERPPRRPSAESAPPSGPELP